MGRPYAKLYRDIWADKDFIDLPAGVQYLYMFLLSQPDLSAAGALALTVRRWAAFTGGATTTDIEAALAILEKRRYILVDYDTQEVLIRTYVRNDGLWRIPNTLYSVLRDAEKLQSPQLRQELAGEFAALPVDELDGKRAEAMKAQITRVTATLSSTVRPRVHPTVRQGLGQLFGQGLRQPKRHAMGVGAGEGAGAGSTAVDVDFNADDRNQSSDRNARDDLTDLIQQEVRKATGRDITAELAATICGDLLRGREVSDAAAYLRSAIRNERDPRSRFLPVASSHPSAKPLGEAERQAGVNGQQPARGQTVTDAAAAIRQAITKDQP